VLEKTFRSQLLRKDFSRLTTETGAYSLQTRKRRRWKEGGDKSSRVVLFASNLRTQFNSITSQIIKTRAVII